MDELYPQWRSPSSTIESRDMDLAPADDVYDPVAVERMTEFGADGVVADLSKAETVSRAVQDADLVVGAVPGFMGYQTVERVLKAGLISKAALDAGKAALSTCRATDPKAKCDGAVADIDMGARLLLELEKYLEKKQ